MFVAAGVTAGIGASGGVGKYMAEWVMHGEPSIDLWPLDIRRFSTQIHRGRTWLDMRGVESYGYIYALHYPGKEFHTGRNLRLSGAYEQMRAQGAHFQTKMGWERASYFRRRDGQPVPAAEVAKESHGGTYNRRSLDWSYVAAEHRAAREKVVVIDQSSFAKLEVSGRDAPSFMQRLANNDLSGPPGTLVYTQLLNDRGGIEADVTIGILSPESFYIVTGAGFVERDFGWVRRNVPLDSDIVLTEVTTKYNVLNLAGPNSRKLLEAMGVEIDISNEAFPFMTWKALPLACGITVRAMRVTFVGELGYELHIPAESMSTVYSAVFRAAEQQPELGVTPAGYRILETCRLEKGYRVWSSDLNQQTTPLEAGLAFCCKWDKPGGFIGREALLEQKKQGGAKRKLACFTLDDEKSITAGALGLTDIKADAALGISEDEQLYLYGNEAVTFEGKVVGYSTSAGLGYTVGKHIVYGFIPTELADRFAKSPAPKGAFQINAYGKLVNMTMHKANQSLYDPKREKILM